MRLPLPLTILLLLSSFLPLGAAEISCTEGWATCSSVTTSGDYQLDGGAGGSLIVLRNDGTDMGNAIKEAILSHDVIVFDGRDGAFELSSFVYLQSLSHRTLIGVNGARLRTKFEVTQEIRDLLDALDVNSLSQHAEDNLGGTLSNGIYVAEQRELTIREALIDLFDDPKEPYRNSGIFMLSDCSDIIMRNLSFEGPGSLDVGGADLLTVSGSDHIWIDHCMFTDGLDGNLDIVNNSDFVTVSDSRFRYTAKAYNHQLSDLTSGTEITDGSPQKNNISWIRCFWAEGCTGRMPWTTLGIHHILNCYWDSPKGTCIDAHNLSRVLIENSCFTAKVNRALAVRDDNVLYEWRGSRWVGHASPASNASITVPYSYTSAPLADVAGIASKTGPTLSEPFARELKASPAVVELGTIYSAHQVDARFNLSAFGADVPERVILTAPEGMLLSTDPEGNFGKTLTIEATDATLLQADIYLKAYFNGSGETEKSITVSAQGVTFEIPVRADVVGIKGESTPLTLLWPLAADTEASTTRPDAFADASLTHGEKIYILSTKNLEPSHPFTLFNPTEAIGKAVDEECCITFDIVSAPDYLFVPRLLSLEASRIGTDMCFIDIECSREQGSPLKLLTGFQPARSSESPSYSNISLPLTTTGTGRTLRIKIYLYNMSSNKQLALANLCVEGDLYDATTSIPVATSESLPHPAEYYDLLGRKISAPLTGHLYIMTSPDGKSGLILHTQPH